ncbi:uncharacterized protein LOC126978494 [Leptidea sinapis]|uniref:uncharacterized protein LOC126978494 n=1 Tax=Leptidea sinapis TaxID=189913 RepID=UPI0021C3B9F4|nr:uncharacterized protein LOC126978494 [Leptidea sinapis]
MSSDVLKIIGIIDDNARDSFQCCGDVVKETVVVYDATCKCEKEKNNAPHISATGTSPGGSQVCEYKAGDRNEGMKRNAKGKRARGSKRSRKRRRNRAGVSLSSASNVAAHDVEPRLPKRLNCNKTQN